MFDYKQRHITKQAGDNYDRIFKKGRYAEKEITNSDSCKKKDEKECSCKK